ncbi:MAG TPA: cytochrome c oxidase assembly protein [Stellaceae bacterium]|nr:cytochrome c oxidase assembly protein [Stellaceae bacterium]
MPQHEPAAQRRRRKNTRVVIGLLAAIGVMVTLVVFSVPLYRLFCAATGFAGTTERVANAVGAVSDRVITVRFNTTVEPGLPWRFLPEQRAVTVRLGEEKLVFFSAENLTDEPIVGHATFNVTPYKAGPYFDKIECFCFTEERLGPRQKVDMPVDFFVNPDLARDPNAGDVHTITLSYSFFRSRAPQKGEDLSRFLASAPPDAKRGKALFAERCASCHSLDENKVGPMLGGVLGRRAGSLPAYSYSAGLKKAGFDWSRQTLDRWLAGPGTMIPGARMPVRVLEPSTRRDIIAYLAAQRREASNAATPAAAAH